MLKNRSVLVPLGPQSKECYEREPSSSRTISTVPWARKELNQSTVSLEPPCNKMRESETS